MSYFKTQSWSSFVRSIGNNLFKKIKQNYEGIAKARAFFLVF